jgi:hypothetical protein
MKTVRQIMTFVGVALLSVLVPTLIVCLVGTLAGCGNDGQKSNVSHYTVEVYSGGQKIREYQDATYYDHDGGGVYFYDKDHHRVYLPHGTEAIVTKQ